MEEEREPNSEDEELRHAQLVEAVRKASNFNLKSLLEEYWAKLTPPQPYLFYQMDESGKHFISAWLS